MSRTRSRRAVIQARYRRHRAAGVATYRVTVHENDLARALVAAGMTYEEVLHKRAVEKALTDLVEQFIQRWRDRYR